MYILGSFCSRLLPSFCPYRTYFGKYCSLYLKISMYSAMDFFTSRCKECAHIQRVFKKTKGISCRNLSCPVGKPTICIGENKGADQLCGNREADQRLCFRYTDSTFYRLFKTEISSFQSASVTVQPDLCRTCSETTLLVFPRGGSNDNFAISTSNATVH